MFIKYCEVSEIEKPDDLLDIYAYRLTNIKPNFWSLIEKYNYNIDYPKAISHMYFLCNDILLATLEITDYENYVLIEEKSGLEIEMNNVQIQNNYDICYKNKEDIDGIAQDEKWKPYIRVEE